MRDPLTPDYLEDCRKRANRYMGQWTGTAGSLAADVRRLLWELERVQGELAVLRARSEERPPPCWLQPHD